MDANLQLQYRSHKPHFVHRGKVRQQYSTYVDLNTFFPQRLDTKSFQRVSMCKTKTSSSVVTSLIHQQVPYLNCIKANTEQQMLFQICESFLAYEAPPLDLFPLYFVTIVPNCGNTMSILTSLDPPFVEKEQANQSWVSQIHHIWNIFGGS